MKPQGGNVRSPVPRAQAGRWAKGASGNPGGRPASRAGVIHAEIAERNAELALAGIEAMARAAAGEIVLGEQQFAIYQAALARVPRSRALALPLAAYDDTAPFSAPAAIEMVKRAMLRGEIDPWTAQAALSALLAGADRSTAPGDWQTDPMIPDLPKREPDGAMH